MCAAAPDARKSRAPLRVSRFLSLSRGARASDESGSASGTGSAGLPRPGPVSSPRLAGLGAHTVFFYFPGFFWDFDCFDSVNQSGMG
jgi:hypothetical protein